MSRTTLNRLARLEEAHRPPQAPYPILLIAADAPDADQQIAEHKTKHGEPTPGRVSVIVLTGVQREPGAIAS
jgi:hypothetical protein